MGLEDQREKRERRELIDAVKGVSIALIDAANIVAYAIQQAAEQESARRGALSGERAEMDRRG